MSINRFRHRRTGKGAGLPALMAVFALIVFSFPGAAAEADAGAGFDDCVLEHLKGSRGDVAATLIAESCARKFPDSAPARVGGTVYAKSSEAPFEPAVGARVHLLDSSFVGVIRKLLDEMDTEISELERNQTGATQVEGDVSLAEMGLVREGGIDDIDALAQQMRNEYTVSKQGMDLLLAELEMISARRLDIISDLSNITQSVANELTAMPAGDAVIVSHREGGIIEEIHVENGMMVRAGAPLVRLRLTPGGVTRAELLDRLDEQRMLRARLETEAIGKGLSFPDEISRRRPEMVAAQRRDYFARQRELEGKLAALRQRLVGKEREVRELETGRRSWEARRGELDLSDSAPRQLLRRNELEVGELEVRARTIGSKLELAGKQLETSARLLEEKLVPELEHQRLKADVESLESEARSIASALGRVRSEVARASKQLNEEVGAVAAETERLDAAVSGVRADIAEIKAELEEVEMRFRGDAQDELAAVNHAIELNEKILAETGGKPEFADIASPVGGLVGNTGMGSIGEVRGPGEGILEIVPSREAGKMLDLKDELTGIEDRVVQLEGQVKLLRAGHDKSEENYSSILATVFLSKLLDGVAEYGRYSVDTDLQGTYEFSGVGMGTYFIHAIHRFEAAGLRFWLVPVETRLNTRADLGAHNEITRRNMWTRMRELSR